MHVVQVQAQKEIIQEQNERNKDLEVRQPSSLLALLQDSAVLLGWELKRL